MHQVQISNHLFDLAARRASGAGFRNVDDYVRDMLEHGVEVTDNFDDLFTPDIIAKLDEAAAQADMGKLITFDELKARRAAKQATC